MKCYKQFIYGGERIIFLLTALNTFTSLNYANLGKKDYGHSMKSRVTCIRVLCGANEQHVS